MFDLSGYFRISQQYKVFQWNMIMNCILGLIEENKTKSKAKEE